ncbi:MAG TPA: DEAD/DEAH box helicase [Mycobacteriales bacterium]|nr:DEAD/DEAH box helicase [Mycobacteriales bacterium]
MSHPATPRSRYAASQGGPANPRRRPRRRGPAQAQPNRRTPTHPAAPTQPPLATRDPRLAVTSFGAAGLPRPLVTALARHGIDTPFPIQGATLPDALAGDHVLGRAQTGSGKTLGFGLPLLARLATSQPGGDRPRTRPGHPRGLILTPTRELAQQVADALAPLGQSLGLKLTTVYGGASMGRQITALSRGVDIVVATPGRLVDHIESGYCALDEVEITVLDEADHMCDLGFLPVVRSLLAQVPADGQRMLFSATLDRDVDGLVREFLPEPVLVAIDPEVPAVDTMTHHVFEAADREAKAELLAALTRGHGRTLMFARTRHGADRVSRALARAGIPAAALHGGMAQNARTRTLRSFTEGGHRVLVATDVAARGIHVDGIDLVVHADPPSEAKAYLHRSGRTARAGAAGTVVTVSLPEERRTVHGLLRDAGLDIGPVPVAAGDPLVTELVGPHAPFVPPAPPTPPSRPRPAGQSPAGQPRAARTGQRPARTFRRGR